jgi:D-galactarolactone cycloisomerase
VDDLSHPPERIEPRFGEVARKHENHDIVPYVLSTPLEEPFAFSQGRVDRRSAMVVEVKTDEGISGWGESLCHGLQPSEIAASFVESCFKPMLVGRDPFDVEVLWEEMYNRTRPSEAARRSTP